MVQRWSIAAVGLSLLITACTPEQPIKLGFLAGLTGSGSELGIGARRSLEMSIAELNRAGRVRGRSLQLVALDDGNEPAQGVEAYRRFEAEGVVAVIGPVASTVMGAVLPYLNEHHILTVSPTVSAVSISGKDDWFFRVITVNRQMGEVLGDYAVQIGLDRVAVLRETSNDNYTKPVLEAFQAKLAAAGRTLGEPVEFDLRKQPDYEALAGRLGSAPGYLILANGYDTAQIGQKLALAGHTGPLLAPPWAMTSDVISLGGRQVERMVFASIYDTQSSRPSFLQFRDEYRQLYGTDPGLSAIFAKDALTLLVKALVTAPSLSPDDLRAAVRSAGTIDGLQTSFHLDEFGDVVRDLLLVTVRDDHFVHVVP